VLAASEGSSAADTRAAVQAVMTQLNSDPMAFLGTEFSSKYQVSGASGSDTTPASIPDSASARHAVSAVGVVLLAACAMLLA